MSQGHIWLASESSVSGLVMSKLLSFTLTAENETFLYSHGRDGWVGGARKENKLIFLFVCCYK